jgi:chaperone BCS1
MKRGHLYFGAPGNGKSSLAAAIGYEYKRHIYFMDINSFSSDEVMKAAFSSIRENSILLIEDIDQVFNGRIPVRNDCQVTFSMFINMLSGVLDKDNLITIITTNKIEELDPALLRAGRMDFHCEVLPPDKETIKKYIEVFYDVEEINIVGEVDSLNMPKDFATLEK